MKSNYNSIADLREDLQDLNEMKRDYVLPGKEIWFENGAVHLSAPDGGAQYDMNDWMKGQAADKAGIPRQFATKIQEKVPGLFEMNLNTLLRKEPEKQHLIRTYHGSKFEGRAMLSDKYGTWDNHDIMDKALLPALANIEDKNINVEVTALTDKRMYIAFTWPGILKEDAIVGDPTEFGAFLRNGEVGSSAVAVGLYSKNLTCLNGQVAADMFRKIHVSRNDNNGLFLTDETKELKLNAMMSEMKDIFEYIASGVPVDEYWQKLIDSKADKIAKPEGTVDNILKKYSIDKETGEIILQNMSDTGNFDRYGLSNGVTFASHQTESIDRQFELERTGSKIIELTPEEWKSVAA